MFERHQQPRPGRQKNHSPLLSTPSEPFRVQVVRMRHYALGEVLGDASPDEGSTSGRECVNESEQ